LLIIFQQLGYQKHAKEQAVSVLVTLAMSGFGTAGKFKLANASILWLQSG